MESSKIMAAFVMFWNITMLRMISGMMSAGGMI
jgi:hypothetical protein